MKKLLLFLLLSIGLNAQFNYQAIVKDSNGNVLTNSQVKFKFTLMEVTSTSTPVYVEEHTVTTPADGVVNLTIGGGTASSGIFSDIDWSLAVFVKEELDTGSGYQDMGTKQFVSVPVAEYAKVTNTSSTSFIKGLGDIIIGSESPDYPQNIVDFYEIVPEATGGNIILGKRILTSRASTDTSYSPTGNIIIGNDAMSEAKSGGSIAIGASAMSNSDSTLDIAIGSNALEVSKGFENIAIGQRSFDELESGSGNIGIGEEVGFNFYGGNHNVGIGYRAFGSSYEKANTVTNTTFNTGVGYGSSYGLVGINNSSFGRESGKNTLGDKNTLLGAYATTAENIEINNATAIGANATVTTSNTIQLGDGNVTLVNTSGQVSATSFRGNADQTTLTYSGTVTNVLAVISDLKSQIEQLNTISVGNLSGLANIKTYKGRAFQTNIVTETSIFTVSYNEVYEQPNWIEYQVRNISSVVERSGDFYGVDGIYTSHEDDYHNNDWDKGHLAPAASFLDSQENLEATFSYLNCALMKDNLNRYEWAQLEQQVRDWAAELAVDIDVRVDLFFDDNHTVLNTGAHVPSRFLKTITLPSGTTFPNETISKKCFEFPNADTNGADWTDFEIDCSQ